MFKLAIFLLLFTKEIQNILVQKNNNVIEENVGRFLKSYPYFNPFVLLVDDTKASKAEALKFVQNLNQVSPNLELLLMKFNMTGASSILESTRNNLQRYYDILQEPPTSSYLGYQNQSTSAMFLGILNAVQMIPPRSAIVVFMDRKIEDEKLSHLALSETTKKSIQVFGFSSNNDRFFKEFVRETGGEFFKLPNTQTQSDFLENVDTFQSLSTLISQTNIQPGSELTFPIDSEVTGIHIKTSKITKGILITPKGFKINLLDQMNIAAFSTGSFRNEQNDVYLKTTIEDIGLWHLGIDNTDTPINVTILVHTKITTNATATKEVVRLGLKGDVTAIKNISFVTKSGQKISSASFAKNWEKYEIQSENRELNVTLKEIPREPFYAIVDGTDGNGNDFRRLSYVRDNTELYLPPITIQVGLGSELITQPNRQPQLFFDVTNNGHSPKLVRFYCRDEKAILLSMSPYYKWISPQETATVRVTLTTRPGAYQDFITFFATGSETVHKKVIVDVGTQLEDRRDPKLNYQFTSDCTNVIFGSCEDGTWQVEVRAKDAESGLLQVTSNPKGLYFPNGFTTGTKEEVTGYYSESCCNPDVKLIAYDRQNNRYSRKLNAYRAALGPGAIAAIVLGVILLILLLIGLGFLCRFCCIKYYGDKGSYDLPIYKRPFSRRSS